MISDLDIWRAANLLIQRHGADAEIEAAKRADQMLERGDLDGQVVWKRIRRAIYLGLQIRIKDGDAISVALPLTRPGSPIHLPAGVDTRMARLAILLLIAACPAPTHAAETPPRPYSCRLLDDEQRKCAYGACDQRVLDRLRKECLRDGGRP